MLELWNPHPTQPRLQQTLLRSEGTQRESLNLVSVVERFGAKTFGS